MSENPPLLPLVKAVETVTGQRIHLSAVLRWTQQGRRGQRLQSWVLGARRMTTEQAVRDFIVATTEASEFTPLKVTASQSNSRGRQREISAAKLRLEKAGI